MLTPVAKVSKLFGLDGGVLINLYDTFTGMNDNGEPLFALIDGLAVPLFIEKFERRGKSGAYMLFSDIDSPQRASEFLSRELFSATAQEIQSIISGIESAESVSTTAGHGGEELSAGDLVGFTALIRIMSEEEGGQPPVQTPGIQIGDMNETAGQGADISGAITDYFDSEMNPLFEISAGGKEILIPVADEFITGIDTGERTVEFEVPQSLVELYL